jgi:hypothetical protein
MTWNGWDQIEARFNGPEWQLRRELRDKGHTDAEIDQVLEETAWELPAHVVDEALLVEMNENPQGRSLPRYEEAA